MNILYRSELALNGYGLAALAYVRHLKEVGAPLGVQVDWQPFFLDAARHRVVPAAAFPSLLVRFAQQIAHDNQWQDLAQLLHPTARGHPPDLTVLHSMPDYWPMLRSASGRHVGYLAWETDALPLSWQSHAALVDAVMVPSHFNAQAVQQAPAWSALPTHVVPHVWRPLSEGAQAQCAAVQQALQLPEGTTVFYTINDWIPRKNLEGLMRAYCRAFKPSDPVALVIKCLPTGQGREGRSYTTTQRLFESMVQSLPQPQPPIRLLPGVFNTQQVDALHLLGHAYISLSHGEGWGMGAFEAATFGKPVIAPAWGGWVDFLGTQWPGAVPCQTVTVPPWAGQDLFTPDQHWCEPDEAAATHLMQSFVEDPAPFALYAHAQQTRLQHLFAPSRVAQSMLAGLRQNSNPQEDRRT